MAAQVTELTFLNHLAPRFSIPIPEHLTDEASGAEIREALARWGSKALVKPDILTGKRGKAGAVRTVTDYAEIQRKKPCTIEHDPRRQIEHDLRKIHETVIYHKRLAK